MDAECGFAALPHPHTRLQFRYYLSNYLRTASIMCVTAEGFDALSTAFKYALDIGLLERMAKDVAASKWLWESLSINNDVVSSTPS